MQLRDYQERALEATYRHLRTRQDNPCVVIPTGGGKTPLIARLCSDAVKEWSGRVIVLAHVKELLEQSFRHLKDADAMLPVGVYSAGLGEKDPGQAVTVAGIQSAVRAPERFQPPNLIIIDEAHRIPPDGEGMYRSFLIAMKEKNPDVRMIGLTATPYRMSTGSICGPDNLLNQICFEVSIRELVAKKYLSEVVAFGGQDETDFSNVTVRGGEFVGSEVEHLMIDDLKVAMAITDLVQRAKDRKSILVFASGVAHGRKIAQMLRESGDSEVLEVYGETPNGDRDLAVKRFRNGSARFLVNVDVLTLGFDAPNVDCVALMRATLSPGLYYQMCGRGFRIAPGKKDCLVVDFGGNVLRHGFVDAIVPSQGGPGTGEAPVKKCPSCLAYVPAGCLTCPKCGHEFPPRLIARHGSASYNGRILSGEPEEIEVHDVLYSLHDRAKSGIPSLRVDYDSGFLYYTEYICLEHDGYAREKAQAWWSRRDSTGQVPASVAEALGRVDVLAKPKRIMVKREGKYERVIAWSF